MYSLCDGVFLSVGILSICAAQTMWVRAREASPLHTLCACGMRNSASCRRFLATCFCFQPASVSHALFSTLRSLPGPALRQHLTDPDFGLTRERRSYCLPTRDQAGNEAHGRNAILDGLETASRRHLRLDRPRNRTHTIRPYHVWTTEGKEARQAEQLTGEVIRGLETVVIRRTPRRTSIGVLRVRREPALQTIAIVVATCGLPYWVSSYRPLENGPEGTRCAVAMCSSFKN